MVLLLVKSPFYPLDTAAMGVPPDQLPLQDGRGLNPLLQNIWMVIHPPIVFVGYVLIAVPFAFALAALSANEFSSWAKVSFPWTLLSASILGLGIFLGGYWAYETLGWGGYWAWDPVENSSLIPWLTNLALVHGLILERSRGSLRKTNLALALIGYLLVIYGTFLTRSGILQEFSVHSFTDLGINAYLIAFMVGFAALSIALYIMRLPSLKKQKVTQEEKGSWFETMMILGALFTILLAVLTWVGTSSPVITTLLKNPSNVTQSFYNTVALPIGIIMAVLIAISSLWMYYARGRDFVIRRLIISTLIGLVGIVIAVLLGVRDIKQMILIFGSIFAIASNIIVIISVPKKNLLKMSGNMTHIGFGVILIGFIVSSSFARSTGVIKLEGNKNTELMGMNCKFLGIQEDFFSKDNKVEIEVDSGRDSYIARPAFYQDIYTNQTVINPFIRKTVLHDIYFAPQRYLPDYTTLTLTKGESNTAFGHEIKFNEFKMDSHAETGAMQVGVVLDVSVGDQVHTITPWFTPNQSQGNISGYTTIPDTDYKIYINRIFADEGKVTFDVVGVGNLVVEISKKPFINLVWFGSILIVIGSFLAYYRRKNLAVK